MTAIRHQLRGIKKVCHSPAFQSLMDQCVPGEKAVWHRELAGRYSLFMCYFPWSGKVKDVLQNVFKLQNFRPLQLETVNVTMARKDIFLVMPTGGGKSLCYQLPALCSDGMYSKNG